MAHINKNQWTAYGVVALEPTLKKLSGGKVMATSILITQSANENVYIPICAFNDKAHVLCALAHKGSIIFAKGIFRSKLTTTSIQAKSLISISMKINEFEVLVREPIRVEDLDFADTVALYDPEAFMEVEGDGEPENSQEARTTTSEK